ncbi:amino acid ABC transporter substrate-binding protein [Romboutsia maritimum]|uniref:Amino acid ABC transporter substrate-binding protein n=1 Tax=Romboutsia maritimum TaxID=2020948 RepID=A0A371IUT2_9FIRM|nr:amino acid ABC transporter substrate-binding protein [Romboutsia maritimum]RDY24231.1 amino acid ABC transporter substrate-binding protein [Romboutsia maritimum]
MKSIVKKLSVIFMSIICLIGVVGCSDNKSKEKKEVIIGFDNTFVPMGFLDENGETVGFDIDLAKETFKRLGLDVKFQNIDWSMKDNELNVGNVDALWNGYSLTEERKQKIAYTDSYLDNKQIIVTLKNSKIKTKSELKGKKIGTQQESASFEAIQKDSTLMNSLDGSSPILYDTFDKAFRDLEIGRTDAIVADEVLARYYMSQKGENKYSILKDNFGEETFVVGFKKDNTVLKDKVNETLKEMKSDGSFDKIYKKWFK